jgi:hypothetical protein
MSAALEAEENFQNPASLRLLLRWNGTEQSKVCEAGTGAPRHTAEVFYR